MDEVEELEFHQQTVTEGRLSPLHLIREKEMELSGRLLSAKREADRIVADARRTATRLVEAAQEEASREAAEHETARRAQTSKQAAEYDAAAQHEAEELERTISGNLPAAITYIVESVVAVPAPESSGDRSAPREV